MEKIVSKLLAVDAATKYISDVFVVGGACRDIALECGFAMRPIYALAPDDASTDKLLDFAHGGILERMPKISDGRTQIQPVPTTIGAAASILWDDLTRCERPRIWVHEPQLTEEQVVARGLGYKVVNGAIYLVYENVLDEKRVAELIRYSLLSWHFLAFVTECLDEVDSVDELIRVARFLLVGAYDGESFLHAAK